jgi:RNA polymerase sigma factor (TIGR02999 family)
MVVAEVLNGRGVGMSDVTRILNAIERGEAKATDELLPLVYEELRLLAAQKLSHELPGQTLQATALVHEAYIRLTGDESQDWNSRGHFFAAAAEAMRRILVESARRKQSGKRGGRLKKVNFDNVEAIAELPSEDVIALDEALARLSEEDHVAAELVKMRYFAGLTLEQTARALGVSPRTADRCWAFAKAWLYHEIRKGRTDYPRRSQ